MSLQRFLNLIDKTPGIGPFFARREELIERTDPERIYVENVRAFFGIPFKAAQYLCDLAVRQRIFSRKIGVTCPGCGKILLAVNSEDEVPETITCDVCELNERDQYIFTRQELGRIIFYKLNR